MIPLPNHLIPGGDLEFRPGLPTNFEGAKLAIAIQSYADTDKAFITSQLFAASLFSIRLTLAKFLQNIQSTVQINREGLYIRFQINSAQRLILNNNQRIQIREDQYSGFFIDTCSCRHKFQSNKKYQTLDMFFSPEFILEFRDAFPELEKWISNRRSNPFIFRQSWITAEMHDVINDLLKTQFNNEAIPLYYDLKVRELFALILHHQYNRKMEKVVLSPFERSRVHEVRKCLKFYISQKPPEFRRLAQMFGIKEMTLREGFRQEYGMSIFEMLSEEKMQMANQLLLSTAEPVKNICKKVGYPSTSSFITAFRKRYGKSPGSYRRKK